MVLPLRLALRELRGGLRGFYIFLTCLFLGVSAIALLGSLSGVLVSGLSQRGQEILGGDVDIRLMHRELSQEENDVLRAQGVLSHVAMMRAMIRHPENGKTLLVEAKAVDGVYPLFGQVQLKGDRLPDDAPQEGGVFPPDMSVFVEASVLQQLGLERGDQIFLGQAQLVIAGILAREPDRLAGGFALGPRVMMSHKTFAATGLNQPGAVISHHYRLKLVAADHPQLDALKAGLDERFPMAGWRVRDRRDASPAVRRTVERVALFLTLVALTALTVGGVGVGNAITAYLDRKQKTLAVMKALGAGERVIVQTYLLQILLLAFGAIMLALAIGAGLPFILAPYLRAMIDIPIAVSVHWPSLAVAAGFGLATALGFSLRPLGLAARLSPAALFRGFVETAEHQLSRSYRLAILLSLLGVLSLSFAISERRDIALYFIVALASSFVLLRLTAVMLQWLARKFGKKGSFAIRLAWRNMERPGSALQSVVLSIGLSVTLIATLAQIEGNFALQLREDFPDRAPSFFAIDIQPDQRQAFAALAQAQAGFEDLTMVPMLRGSVLAINDTPASDLTPPPDIAWFLRGDRGLTYSSDPPEGSEITAGQWWSRDYQGPPLVSMDARIADGLGIGLGDLISVNILGRKLTAEITSLRKVDYASGQIGFALVFSPQPLQAAPHTMLASTRFNDGDEVGFSQSVTAQFPNVTLIRVKEAVETVSGLLAQFSRAIWFLSLVSILASALVLAGALASSRQTRLKDAAILVSLGVKRRDLVRIFATEYVLICAFTSIIAAMLACVASWGVLEVAMRAGYSVLPFHLAGSIAGAFVLTLILSGLTLWGQLRSSAAALLRHE